MVIGKTTRTGINHRFEKVLDSLWYSTSRHSDGRLRRNVDINLTMDITKRLNIGQWI